MSEVRFVSNSEIQSWKRCRRKWYLGYQRRLKLRREDPTGARSIGNRVHAVLASHYELQVEHGGWGDGYGPLQLHDELVAEDIEAFPMDADAIRKESDLSRAMVEGYFEWLEDEGADEGLVVIAPEQPLQHELPNGVVLRGKIDLRVRREHDDAVMTLDHKTVGEFTTPVRTLKFDEQMQTYLLLERLNDPAARTDGAIYNMIRRVKRTAAAKPPFFKRLEVRFNKHVLREFYQRVCREVADIVEAEREVESGDLSGMYPSPTKACSWDCDFFGVCPLMDDPTAGAESIISALYEVGDPNARYAPETTA